MTQTTTQPEAYAELYAQKARLFLKGQPELLSSGMTGVTRVAFSFSEDWEGMQKTAVFSNGTVTIDVPEADWAGMVCTVPQQVLASAGKTLMVGVYGTDGEERTLPTVWCALGRVELGAVPAGVDALPPEAPLWARLQKQLGDVAAANPFVVKGLSMLPRDDDSLTLELNRRFEEIQQAVQANRPVFLEVSGTVLPLSRLIAGDRAEFTGAVRTTQQRTYYLLCTLPETGDAVLQTLPIGSTLAEEAIEAALAQAKASGMFDGAPGPAGPQGASGQRGSKILKITTSSTSYTTTVGGFKPTYRFPLANILSESGSEDVLPGDVLWRSYYHYPVGYVDASYVYTGAYTNIRGAAGAAGSAGKDGDDGYTPQKGVDYWTGADQESIVQQVIAALGTPVFGKVDADNNIILTGELADGTYTIVYEDAEGNVTEIGTYTGGRLGDVPITPVWNKPYKLDSGSGAVNADSGNTYAYSDGIPFIEGTELHISCSDTTEFHAHFYYYDADDNFVGKTDWAVGTTTGVVTPVPETVISQMPGAAVVKLRCNVAGNGHWHKLDRLTIFRRHL